MPWFFVNEDWDRLAVASDEDLRAMLGVRLDAWTRIHGVRLSHGDASALPPLVDQLHSWKRGPKAWRALEAAGWKPEDATLRVLALAAARDLEGLRADFDSVQDVLLAEVASQEARRVENGVYHLMAIGRGESLWRLKDILLADGTKSMAETYLNAGSNVLEEAAREWAEQRGYRITRGSGAHETNWGSYR